MAGTYSKIWTHDRRRRAKRDEEKEEVPPGFTVSSVSIVGAEWYDPLRRRYDEAKRACAREGGRQRHRLQTAPWSQDLDAIVNEWLLFHGASASAADSIAQVGFLKQHTSEGGTCGRAFYFAESSTKADEYASPQHAGDHRVIVLCRVLGGDVHTTDEKKPCKLMLEAFHSILNDRRKCSGTYREVAIALESHVVPECIVRYVHSSHEGGVGWPRIDFDHT